MTPSQKTAIQKLAQKECGIVIRSAEEYDGFKHRNSDALMDIVGDDEKQFDAGEDYLFDCIAKIRNALMKGAVTIDPTNH